MTAARKQQVRSVLDVKRTGLTHNINEMKRAFELLARMIADKGLRVVFKGTKCATDNKTVYLPELSLLERKGMSLKEVEEAQAFLSAVRGFLFHEVGHVLYTDEKVWNEMVKEALKDKMLLLKHATNAVEDPRIEKRLADAWRGAGVSLREMNEWMLKKIQAGMAKEPLIGKVIVGIAWVTRTGTNHWFYEGLDDASKNILKHFAPEIRAARRIESTEEAVRLARRIVKKLRALVEEKKEQPQGGKKQKSKGVGNYEPGIGSDPDEEEEEDDGEEEEHAGADEESEGQPERDDDGGGSEDDSDDESDEDGDGDDEAGASDDEEDSEDDEDSGDDSDEGASGDDAGDADGEDPSDAEGNDGADELDESTRNKLEEELEAEDTAERLNQMLDKGQQLASFVKPPGNNDKYLIYTTEYDKADPAEERPAREYKQLMDKGREHFGILKRNLGNVLKARSHVMTITELEEGELDSSMLYRLASGLGDRVFKEDFEHLDTNVGVVLLVNESGSMNAVTSYQPPRLSRIDLAKITAALMAEVLDSLGIDFACYGHTTADNADEVFWEASEQDQETFSRWGATQVYVYKDFDESFNATKNRIPSMAARMNTHDAEALVFSANKLLARRGVQRRIIMTIDDGAPQPNEPNPHTHYDPKTGGYGHASVAAQRNIGMMAQKHQDYVREVVATLGALGVEVLGMGMGTEDVRYFYEKWCSVRDVAAFPVIALKELKKLLTMPSKK